MIKDNAKMLNNETTAVKSIKKILKELMFYFDQLNENELALYAKQLNSGELEQVYNFLSTLNIEQKNILQEKLTHNILFNTRQEKNDKICLVSKVQQWLIENIEDSSISIYKICAQVGTNHNTLSRKFKKKLDTTVFSWLREQRMLMAAELLVTTEQSIMDITLQVGYSDPNNFSTTFKRKFNVSPLAYRKSS